MHRTASVDRVQHVVILMQENRSFDHYFGTLRGVCGFDDAAAMILRNGAPVFQQPSKNGSVLPFHMDTTTTNAHCFGNQANDWLNNHAAWNDGHNDRWTEIKSPLSMGYFTRADLPFHYALADAFTICDNYRCSIMASTGPNRTYLWSGMIDPNGTYEGPIIHGSRESGLTWTTYAERLEDAGVSWKLYQVAADNYNDNGLAYFTQFEHAKPGEPLHDRGMASVAHVTGDTALDIAAAIEKDVLEGTLPKVSWIVGPASTSEHPDHTPAAGADFMHRIIMALTIDAEVWASTVLLINYDENDDFFDHAVPVTPPPGTPDEFVDGLPIGLGARVPLIVVSPWSRGGHVCSELFDHTSVIRFLELCTGVMEPNISAWRRRVCGDLTSAFDFSTTVTELPPLPDTVLPSNSAVAERSALPAPVPPVRPSMPTQEPGSRPRRPLPYRPNVVSRIDTAGGRVRIGMTNSGSRSVHFSIYANNRRDDGPWQYDVSADQGEIEACFDAHTQGNGNYDLSVYGPTGFLRRLTGNVGTGVDVVLDHDPITHDRFTLTMTNSHDTPVVFKIAARAGCDDEARTYPVLPGQSVTTYQVVAANSGHRYDVTATVDVDAQFLRRFAGRLETSLGAPMPVNSALKCNA